MFHFISLYSRCPCYILTIHSRVAIVAAAERAAAQMASARRNLVSVADADDDARSVASRAPSASGAASMIKTHRLHKMMSGQGHNPFGMWQGQHQRGAEADRQESAVQDKCRASRRRRNAYKLKQTVHRMCSCDDP